VDRTGGPLDQLPNTGSTRDFFVSYISHIQCIFIMAICGWSTTKSISTRNSTFFWFLFTQLGSWFYTISNSSTTWTGAVTDVISCVSKCPTTAATPNRARILCGNNSNNISYTYTKNYIYIYIYRYIQRDIIPRPTRTPSIPGQIVTHWRANTHTLTQTHMIQGQMYGEAKEVKITCNIIITLLHCYNNIILILHVYISRQWTRYHCKGRPSRPWSSVKFKVRPSAYIHEYVCVSEVKKSSENVFH